MAIGSNRRDELEGSSAATALGVIPARYASTRFPGKALAPILGRPMLEWVWLGARQAKRLRAVMIATDDERIAEAALQFGAEVVLTRSDHPSGTDRIAEATQACEDALVVNVQGDEPLIEGSAIDCAIDALAEAPDASASTLIHPMAESDLPDPNRVKVVLDSRGNAVSFSRRAVPAGQRKTGAEIWQHVGLYVYRRALLDRWSELPQTRSEIAEGLEQLRILEHGHAIRCAVTHDFRSQPVDVPADIAPVEQRLRELGRA
ncbi:3-deoxy-manno-octulosonate cytidylyltransferase [Myxococcota bacterium]|nr:3-deoxy-manno-octulosonate cytidylyltransferase [Myxococcota bacterium]